MQALFGARYRGDGGDAEVTRQAADIDVDALALGLVHQVDADDDAVSDFKHLQNKVEVALERGGVDDDDGAVGASEEDEVAADLFVLRRGEKRVGAGQVDQLVVFVLEGIAAFGALDGLAGPVADVLAQAGERVEHR